MVMMVKPTYFSFFVGNYCLLNSSTIVVLWGVAIVHSSVSTPWTPPASFHSGAHWRLLVPRKNGQQRLHPLVINRSNSNSNVDVCTRSRGSCVERSTPTTTTTTTTLKLSKSSSDDADTSIIAKIAQALGLGVDQSLNQQSPLNQPTTTKSSKPKQTQGSVIRTAARPHQSNGGSIPSSRYYTTRKPSSPMIAVDSTGVTADYNHYRTVALQSTLDRAISILTSDVSAYIQSGYSRYTDGDLGENVLVEGVEFGYFQVGQRYKFSSQKKGGADADGGSSVAMSMEDVVVEITERMEPCANLCKLPYINDPTIPTPKERMARCLNFLESLDKKDGLRGWYAKVIQGGVINVGDSLEVIGAIA